MQIVISIQIAYCVPTEHVRSFPSLLGQRNGQKYTHLLFRFVDARVCVCVYVQYVTNNNATGDQRQITTGNVCVHSLLCGGGGGRGGGGGQLCAIRFLYNHLWYMCGQFIMIAQKLEVVVC